MVHRKECKRKRLSINEATVETRKHGERWVTEITASRPIMVAIGDPDRVKLEGHALTGFTLRGASDGVKVPARKRPRARVRLLFGCRRYGLSPIPRPPIPIDVHVGEDRAARLARLPMNWIGLRRIVLHPDIKLATILHDAASIAHDLVAYDDAGRIVALIECKRPDNGARSS